MEKNNSNIDLGKSFETLKNNNMKAIIKRVIVPGQDPQFQIWGGETLIACKHYKPDAPAGDIWNEQLNMDEAKKIAAQIEAGEKRIEETIYETPDDIPAELFTKPGTE